MLQPFRFELLMIILNTLVFPQKCVPTRKVCMYEGNGMNRGSVKQGFGLSCTKVWKMNGRKTLSGVAHTGPERASPQACVLMVCLPVTVSPSERCVCVWFTAHLAAVFT